MVDYVKEGDITADSGSGAVDRTAVAAAAAAAATTSNTKHEFDDGGADGINEEPTSRQDGDDGADHEGDNLWEQMTAREGRDAARAAGMSVGDWQAERQLQEVLRESAQEAGTTTGASAAVSSRYTAGNGGDERSFVDAAFHALAASAVEGEEDEEESHTHIEGPHHNRHRPHQHQHQQYQHQQQKHRPSLSVNGNGHGLSTMMHSVDDRAAAAATEAAGSGRIAHAVIEGGSAARGNTGAKLRQIGNGAGGKGKCVEDEEDEDEEDEDFGDDEVELVVTRDGGIRPVAAAAAAAGKSAAGIKAAVRAPVGQKPAVVRKAGARVGYDGNDDGGGAAAPAAFVGNGRRSASGQATSVDGGEEAGDGNGEEEEDGIPLPPDIMLTLADDVLHRVMLLLDPEDIFECRAVSSRWEFPAHEAVFEGLCRRTYLAQSAKKLLNVTRWRTWERMFKFRPRLRDTGLYSLKTTYFKKPVRDMSTEWTPGKILKVTYFRYFRFFGDGRVAYGLTHETPKEFVRLLQEGSPKVVYGTYTIRKWEVEVHVPQPWSWVSFTLQLANGERGRFTHLVMLRHSSVSRNDPRSGRCNHAVKSTDLFKFRRVRQF